MPKTLTLKEAAERLEISRQGLLKKAGKAGMLRRETNPFVRGGFHWTISERDVEKLKEKQQ